MDKKMNEKTDLNKNVQWLSICVLVREVVNANGGVIVLRLCKGKMFS